MIVPELSLQIGLQGEARAGTSASTTSSMCTLQQEGHTRPGDDLPDDRFKITFRIGVLDKQPLTFVADVYAAPTWNR